MCGIAGVVTSAEGRIDREMGRRLLDSLEHRGPDDAGFLVWSGVGEVHKGRDWPTEATGPGVVLVHRRLSILDLAETGWQPMSSADDRFHLVFNGEIYNYVELRRELQALGHSFVSTSDSEVLLAAWAQWGRAVLPRLVGMFAFAVLDTRERTVTLARDFFGIKPLYYAVTPRGLAFASEIKSLLPLSGERPGVNPQRLFEYLRFGLTDHGDETLFANVRQLPAAHCLVVPLEAPAGGRAERYWEVDLAPRTDLSFGQAAERMRELFLESVALHLRSDVPVGAALSGGIDSAAIVMAMRHLDPALEIHTFSYIADDPALSEERWIDLVGGAAGAVVHKIHPQPEELSRDLEHLIFVQDEPFGSTSIYAQHRVFQLAHEVGIKVMLDGQGADELLGGYPSYRAARLASLLRQGRWVEAARFAGHAGRQPGMRPGRLALVALGLLTPPTLQGYGEGLLGDGLTPAWLERRWFAERGVRFRVPRRNYGRDMLRNRLHHTLVEANLPMLLRYEDRNSMSFSIESRVPFLTPALASFVLSLPEEYLISPEGETKSVFRAAMRGIVPDAILDRRDKIGFATPEQRWLRTLEPWVGAILHPDRIAGLPALAGAQVGRDWEQVRCGRRRFDFRTWRSINLVRWAERFDVDFA
jgi:asparagine synthase (glutamine-hydrolysing)